MPTATSGRRGELFRAGTHKHKSGVGTKLGTRRCYWSGAGHSPHCTKRNRPGRLDHGGRCRCQRGSDDWRCAEPEVICGARRGLLGGLVARNAQQAGIEAAPNDSVDS